MDPSTIRSEIRSLGLDERIPLVHAIWDDIAADRPTIELSDTFKAELDRRIALDELDPSRSVA